ncbi:MAG: sigma-70 region 4 domain-containing protein [Saprospiraceae bacterium]|nr:sigma-70 region 4 domain-containing protein [Saprospiraceae bacterium]
MYAFIYEMRPLDRALMLLYLEDKSHSEISEILGISKTNVGTKIGRLKTLLQERFNQKKNKKWNCKKSNRSGFNRILITNPHLNRITIC